MRASRCHDTFGRGAESLADLGFIEVTPVGEFMTYGIGVRLVTMRIPEAARGRAPA